MNLIKLKYFIAVCEEKSVIAAAERLHISQPSLSCAIKELEKEYGVSLFKRQHKGMLLTAEGEEFFKLSKSLIAHAESVEQIMNELGCGRKVLRLGVPPMIGSIILPKIYGEFLAENPNVKLEITEAGREELLKLLNEDRIDAAFLPHVDSIANQYKSIKVAQFEIVCCKKGKEPLSKSNCVSAKDLENKPIILFNDDFFQTIQIKKWFFTSGQTPNVIMQTQQLSTLENMISSGKAIGFMFKQLCKKTGLQSVSLDKPMNVSVSLVWKNNKSTFKSMQNFLHYLKDFNIND